MSVLKTYGDDMASYKPSRTYRIKDGHIQGFVDGREAVAQAIDLMLSTERFMHTIYSADYGAELAEFIGKPQSMVAGDLERRIAETLQQDDRITGLQDFSIAFERDAVKVVFTALTTFGEIKTERGIILG